MLKKIFVLLFSVIVALLVISNGYGVWRDNVRVKGSVNTASEFVGQCVYGNLEDNDNFEPIDVSVGEEVYQGSLGSSGEEVQVIQIIR